MCSNDTGGLYHLFEPYNFLDTPNHFALHRTDDNMFFIPDIYESKTAEMPRKYDKFLIIPLSLPPLAIQQ